MGTLRKVRELLGLVEDGRWPLCPRPSPAFADAPAFFPACTVTPPRWTRTPLSGGLVQSTHLSFLNLGSPANLVGDK